MNMDIVPSVHVKDVRKVKVDRLSSGAVVLRVCDARGRSLVALTGRDAETLAGFLTDAAAKVREDGAA